MAQDLSRASVLDAFLKLHVRLYFKGLQMGTLRLKYIMLNY